MTNQNRTKKWPAPQSWDFTATWPIFDPYNPGIELDEEEPEDSIGPKLEPQKVKLPDHADIAWSPVTFPPDGLIEMSVFIDE